MWVQKIPEFHSGHILKQEMMVELSAYLYHLGPLLYQNCTDGIVSGCTLTTTEDSIVVNPGVIRYEGELYLIREPQLIHYTPTNTTRVLNIVFHDQVQTDSFVTREMELAFTEGASSETRYLELCRFKLQPGARLRYTYTSFADRETEYDTLNTIHAPFCGMGRPTLSPDHRPLCPGGPGRRSGWNRRALLHDAALIQRACPGGGAGGVYPIKAGS